MPVRTSFKRNITIKSDYPENGKISKIMAKIMTDSVSMLIRILIQLTIGMLRGLTYLRYRRIVHGNIKASNVFRDPATGLGILGDFRLPGIQSFDDLAKAENSLHYMSPELLLSQGAQASPKSDLWALAATICQLMTRLPPHSQMSRKELEVQN